MILVKKSADLQKYLAAQKHNGLTIGFAPTMGALHKGHLSLIESSRKDNSITVCSIFVNPAQFNNIKDFEKYPITTGDDIYVLESAGTDVLYLPSVEDIYPPGTVLQEHYDLGYLETILEGKYRPGHFQGVCKVMQRLLSKVLPDNLYLGQKDYQQCMVIEKLIEIMEMKLLITLNICPTLREPDGLAMSSRNLRLTKDERQKAPAIFQTLTEIKNNWPNGNFQDLKQNAKESLHSKGFSVDYLEIADATSLQLVHEWDGKQKLVALVAAFLNEVRLIDNMVLGPEVRKTESPEDR